MLLALTLACAHQPAKVTIQVDGRPVRVEVARTPEARAQGLMNRDHLPAEEGMLFVYEEEAPRAFWMKNTRIPLSIAYADKSGKIVRIADMQPFVTDRTPSLYPAQYALEMNVGWFAANGVEVGDRMTELPR